MIRSLTRLTLFVTQTIAFAALAQSGAPEPATSEFGRTFGGEIQAITKHSDNLSGSLGLRMGPGGGYEGTLGGSLVQDRLWFFASASTVSGFDFGSRGQSRNAAMTAQPVDWSTVSASFSDRRNAIPATSTTSRATLPSSFLSLRSTSILSDGMVIDISFSRQTASPQTNASPFDLR